MRIALVRYGCTQAFGRPDGLHCLLACRILNHGSHREAAGTSIVGCCPGGRYRCTGLVQQEEGNNHDAHHAHADQPTHQDREHVTFRLYIPRRRATTGSTTARWWTAVTLLGPIVTRRRTWPRLACGRLWWGVFLLVVIFIPVIFSRILLRLLGRHRALRLRGRA